MYKTGLLPLGVRSLIVVFGFITLGCDTNAEALESKPEIRAIQKGDDPKKILVPPKIGRLPLAMKQELVQALAKVKTAPGDLPRLTVEVDGETLQLPLRKTSVQGNLVGHLAEVSVTQTYNNPFQYPIEAVVVFPLPENSAVTDMKMIIDDRIIKSLIKKRQAARKLYETAKQEGFTAALTEQERPNIFTQSVANIEPNSQIEIELKYVQNLTYDGGKYEFVFPMVVGPRFIPGTPSGSNNGSGWARDTNEVPDASRITPPVVGGGVRSGHDIDLELTIDAGVPIRFFDVPTHDVEPELARDGQLSLRLSPKETIANRDFVLRYGVSAPAPKAALLTHRQDKKGYFSLVLHPPHLDVEELVGEREIIFVVDVSGSMSGLPLAMCKQAMAAALTGLRPADTFNVITFAGRTARVFAEPRPSNNTNIQQALDFVSGLRAGGGTLMGDGVQAALDPSVETRRKRFVFFMTDGYVGNESSIVSMTRRFVTQIEARQGTAKVFSFGTGSSVNRHLLEGLAAAGKGLAVYATTREDPVEAVDRFYRYIDHLIMENIRIDWNGLDVTDVYPAEPGDLFASHPLLVQGRFKTPVKNPVVTIEGTADGRPIRIPVTVDWNETGQNEVLAPLWARAKIDWLEKSLVYEGYQKSLEDEITALGLTYRLVTAYTSFVAVDRSKRVNGKRRTIVQPVETPEGVDPQMAGAEVLSYMSGLQGAPGQMGRRDLNRSNNHYGIRGTGRGGGGTGRGAIGLGGLNTIGSGGGGGTGAGYGRGAGGRSKAGQPPRVRMGSVTVKGGLSKEVIRRIIRRHMNELKFCYEKRLIQKPDLAGKMVLKVVVSSSDGAVQKVVLKSSTLNDKPLELCIQKNIRRWTFPSTGDSGILVLTIPLTFP